jgi:hypothetical protein
MRPFAGLSERELESAAEAAVGEVHQLLESFTAAWPRSTEHEDLEPCRHDLHSLGEALSRAEQRIAALSDELRLRDHWRQIAAHKR